MMFSNSSSEVPRSNSASSSPSVATSVAPDTSTATMLTRAAAPGRANNGRLARSRRHDSATTTALDAAIHTAPSRRDINANTTPSTAIAIAAQRRHPGSSSTAASAAPAKPNTPAMVMPLGLFEANRKMASGTDPMTAASAKLRRRRPGRDENGRRHQPDGQDPRHHPHSQHRSLRAVRDEEAEQGVVPARVRVVVGTRHRRYIPLLAWWLARRGDPGVGVIAVHPVLGNRSGYHHLGLVGKRSPASVGALVVRGRGAAPDRAEVEVVVRAGAHRRGERPARSDHEQADGESTASQQASTRGADRDVGAHRACVRRPSKRRRAQTGTIALDPDDNPGHTCTSNPSASPARCASRPSSIATIGAASSSGSAGTGSATRRATTSTWRRRTAPSLRPGSCRGIHYTDVPPGQAKWVTCIAGAVFDVVVDLARRLTDVRSLGRRVARRCRSARRVPERGPWPRLPRPRRRHRAIYACSSVYEPSRDREIDPLDPDLAIGWPTQLRDGSPVDVVLSAKDRAAPGLAATQAANLLPRYDVVRSHLDPVT